MAVAPGAEEIYRKHLNTRPHILARRKAQVGTSEREGPHANYVWPFPTNACNPRCQQQIVLLALDPGDVLMYLL